MDYLSAFLKRLLFVGGGDEVFLPYSLYIFSDKLISCFVETLINKSEGVILRNYYTFAAEIVKSLYLLRGETISICLRY